MKKIIASLAVAIALTVASSSAFAESSVPLLDGTLMAADVFIVRPVAVGYGAVSFTAWPFAAGYQAVTGNDIKPVTKALIEEPVWFLFERPIGKFSKS